MKKKQQFIGLWLLFLVLCGGFTAWAQPTLATYEYWFDDQYSSKISVPLAGNQQSHHLTAAVDITSLSDGLHSFYLRYKDSEDQYSGTIAKFFYKTVPQAQVPRQLTNYEYWFNYDRDSKVTGSMGPQSETIISLDITPDALMPGLHTFHFRYFDDLGTPSGTLSQFFYKHDVSPESLSTLVEWEYWFNDQFETRQTETIGGGLTEQTLITAIPLENEFEGLHTFYFRYKDNHGRWSGTTSYIFYIAHEQATAALPQAYMYWLDGDYDNRIIQSVNGTGSAVLVEKLLDVSTLHHGVHTLHVRTQDSRGLWSSTIHRMFYKADYTPVPDADLATLEYWFNGDPANKQQIQLNSGTKTQTLNPVIGVEGLDMGIHTFHVKATDTRGLSSAVSSYMFFKPSFAPHIETNLSHYEYWYNDDWENKQTISIPPGDKVQTIVVDTEGIDELEDGVHTLYLRALDTNDQPSGIISGMFMKLPQEITATPALSHYEYWYNGDRENKQTISIPPGDKVQTIVVDTEGISELEGGVHTLYLRALDTNDQPSGIVNGMFMKLPEEIKVTPALSHYEYWFNDDQVNKKTVNFSGESFSEVITLAESEELSTGVHHFYLRAIDQHGKPSGIISQMFVKTPTPGVQPNRIAGYRYWPNEHFDWVRQVDLETPVEVANVTTELNMRHIPKGEYEMVMQFQDMNGQWSNIVRDSVEKDPFPIADFDYDLVATLESSTFTFENKSIDGDFFEWNYGDGSAVSNDTEPQHTFTKPGWYTITLKAVDIETGREHEVEQVVKVIGHTESTIEIAACGEYTSPSGEHIWASSGEYTDVIPNSFEGDSILTVQLTIHPLEEITMEVRVCKGADHTFPDDHTVTNIVEDFDYMLTLKSQHDCDSTVVYEVKVGAIYDEEITLEVCANETFTFGGEVITEPGDYLHTYESVYGCDSTVALTISFLPVTQSQVQATICSGESYFYNGVEYTSGGSFTQTTENENGCNNIVRITITENPTYTVSRKESICEGETFRLGFRTLRESGNYTQVLKTQTGCDSTVNLQLTVHPVVTHEFETAICAGDTYSIADTEYTEAGSYTHLFQTKAGCDSTVTVHLKINPVYDMAQEAVICQGETYRLANRTLRNTGVYQHRFTSITGCDSLVTINLKVNPVHTVQHVEEVCVGESVTFGGVELWESGNYTHLFKSSTGCDSTVNLTIKHWAVYDDHYEVTVCEGESYLWGDELLTQSGTYPIELQTQNGCDSIVTLHLTVNPHYEETHIVELCEGESYTFNGEQYASSGTFEHLFHTASGCDSLIYLDITMHPLPVITLDAVIISRDAIMLDAGNPGATFLWNTGATTQTVRVERSGNYTVVVTSPFGCETEEEITVVITSATAEMDVSVYPNPFHQQINLDNIGTVQNIKLISAQGQVLLQELHQGQPTRQLEITDLADGMYYLALEKALGELVVIKLIKK